MVGDRSLGEGWCTVKKRKPRELEWGETPWDDMPREELLREMQRAYAAVNAARSVLGILQGPDPSAFWKPRGSGYRALAMCTAVTSRVEERFDSESVYRAFYRYAVDVLFAPELGFGWAVCENGHMVGAGNDMRPPTKCFQCKKPMRPIEWRDIERPSPSSGNSDEGSKSQ
jgi:hypothetical protein